MRPDPLPAGMEMHQGLLIDDGSAVEAIGVGAAQMLWLKRLLHYDGPDAVFQIVAVLDVPTLGPGEVVLLGSCGLDGGTDLEIVAIAPMPTGDEEVHSKISGAWRASQGRFEPISTTGLLCVSPRCD